MASTTIEKHAKGKPGKQASLPLDGHEDNRAEGSLARRGRRVEASSLQERVKAAAKAGRPKEMDGTTIVSLRLPAALVSAVDDIVARSGFAYRDRSQFLRSVVTEVVMGDTRPVEVVEKNKSLHERIAEATERHTVKSAKRKDKTHPLLTEKAMLRNTFRRATKP